MKSKEYINASMYAKDMKSLTQTSMTPKLAIAFFVLAGIFAAIWVWTSLILA